MAAGDRGAPLGDGSWTLIPAGGMNFVGAVPCLPRHPRLELGPTAGGQITRNGAWRGGRVVDRTALEMRHRCKPIGGSNPSLSATLRPAGLRVAGHPRTRGEG